MNLSILAVLSVLGLSWVEQTTNVEMTHCVYWQGRGIPEIRQRRPEEFWRPAKGRDLDKYKPRHLAVSERQERPETRRKVFKRNVPQSEKLNERHSRYSQQVSSKVSKWLNMIRQILCTKWVATATTSSDTSPVKLLMGSGQLVHIRYCAETKFVIFRNLQGI